MKRRNRPEQALQMAVMRYLRMACPYAISLHIPNGGYRRVAEAAIMKGMGVMAGCPDILILWPNGNCAFIELKAPGGSARISPAQRAFHMRLLDVGVAFAVCESIDEVRHLIKEWGVPCNEVSYG